MKALYQLSHDLDGTRPVIDTSGYIHVKTDIYDTHDYIQELDDFRARYRQEKLPVAFPDLVKYTNQPYLVSEYGGIWWNKEKQENNWGYGQRPQSEEEFLERFQGLTQILLDSKISGFCYTQLYDVEQEQTAYFHMIANRNWLLKKLTVSFLKKQPLKNKGSVATYFKSR